MTSGAAPRGLPQTVPAMATGSSIPLGPRLAQHGFTYLGLMFLIAFIGIGLAAAGTAWQTEVQREREKELLFIGEQYAMAIGSYYESTPGGLKQYPASLEDLLLDNRFSVVRRHLRKLYHDPVTGGEEWGLVKQQERIIGVYSLSPQRPLKKAEFPMARTAFAASENYAAWQFIYTPGALQAAQQLPPDAGGFSGAFPPVQPVNPASESGRTDVPPSNRNSPASDSDIGRKSTCLGQRASDMPACSHFCKGEGPVAECSLCQASLARRYNACLKGESLPPLANGN